MSLFKTIRKLMVGAVSQDSLSMESLRFCPESSLDHYGQFLERFSAYMFLHFLRWVINRHKRERRGQARNQSGQTKPYVSRLGSCQCCTLKLKCRIAMNLAFLGIFWTYTENLSYITDNFPKQGYKVLFFPYPAATMAGNYGPIVD